MNATGRRQNTGDIERDIAETRRRLSRHLAVLDREYALRNAFVHALRLAGQRNGVPSLAAAAKQNALPLGLIGIGVAWMTFADPHHVAGRRLRDAIGQTWRMLETAVGGAGTPKAGPSTDKNGTQGG